jgi:hypothetical protein
MADHIVIWSCPEPTCDIHAWRDFGPPRRNETDRRQLPAIITRHYHEIHPLTTPAEHLCAMADTCARDPRCHEYAGCSAIPDTVRITRTLAADLFRMYEVWWHEIGTIEPSAELAATGVAELLTTDDAQLLDDTAEAIHPHEPELRATIGLTNTLHTSDQHEPIE